MPAARMVNIDGTQILVRDSANDHGRPPVVLLHGLSMTSDSCWYGSYAPLAARHRVVAFDLRGHGSGIPVKGHFSLEACADDVLAVADALGLGRFIAVGYSIGGLIAQTLWHRDRRAVSGLVLGATAHYPLTPVEWALERGTGDGNEVAARSDRSPGRTTRRRSRVSDAQHLRSGSTRRRRASVANRAVGIWFGSTGRLQVRRPALDRLRRRADGSGDHDS